MRSEGRKGKSESIKRGKSASASVSRRGIMRAATREPHVSLRHSLQQAGLSSTLRHASPGQRHMSSSRETFSAAMPDQT